MEFWFDFASTYSYLAAARVEAVVGREGIPLAWRAFLLGPIFQQQLGIKDSPFNVQPVRGRYMWRDVERLAGRAGLPFRRPTVFPRNSILAARVALALEGRPELPAYCRAVFAANFAADRDISDRAVLAEILREQSLDAEAALEAAVAPENKARLRARTEEAMARGVFGAPSFFVGDELFFGNDRLEEAVWWWAHQRR
jgi:2-hydroxychromene-2-carboxylate isomerase